MTDELTPAERHVAASMKISEADYARQKAAHPPRRRPTASKADRIESIRRVMTGCPSWQREALAERIRQLEEEEPK